MFKVFPKKYSTSRGHRVYSRPEKELSDFFAGKGWYYNYEKWISLGGRRWRPDFYLPKYNVFVEYLGMINNKVANRSYRYKQYMYGKNKLRVIYLYPSQIGKLGETFLYKLRRFKKAF